MFAVCSVFLMGLVIALVTGWLGLPILRRLKARQVISTDAPQRHQAKGGTPTMGGIIILVGALVAAVGMPMPGDTALRWAVVFATVGFGIVGFVDDYLIVTRGKNLGLRAREKLLGQFVVAILFAAWHYHHARYTLGSLPVSLRLLLATYHVLLLVGMSNAVNLTDGLDGLAAGVSLPVWVTLGFLGALLPLSGKAVLGSDWGMVTFCAAFAGATLGYLWYNAHPAQVFMGDTGSLAIGGAMGAAAIAFRLEWILLVAAGVHLAEAASVVLQVISFKTTGKRIFKMSPLHHHFELCNVPETQIVVRFALASVLCGLAAMLIRFGG